MGNYYTSLCARHIVVNTLPCACHDVVKPMDYAQHYAMNREVR